MLDILTLFIQNVIKFLLKKMNWNRLIWFTWHVMRESWVRGVESCDGREKRARDTEWSKKSDMRIADVSEQMVSEHEL